MTNESDILDQGGQTRRKVLKTLGAGGLGATALVGSAAAARDGETGGDMLLAGEPQVGVPFRALQLITREGELPASCFADESTLKTYDSFLISYGRTFQTVTVKQNVNNL